MASRPELNESDRLLLFVYRLDELRKRTFYPYAREFTPETRMHVSRVGEEQFMAFLMSFRHFVLQDEPTHMDSLAKIVKRYAFKKSDADLLDAAKQADRTFRHAKPELEVLGEDETVRARVTEDELFRFWLNGRYFHNDFDGLMMLMPGRTAITEKLKAVFLFSVVRHLQRLEQYEPLVKFIVLNGDLPRGYLRPGTPEKTQS